MILLNPEPNNINQPAPTRPYFKKIDCREDRTRIKDRGGRNLKTLLDYHNVTGRGQVSLTLGYVPVSRVFGPLLPCAISQSDRNQG